MAAAADAPSADRPFVISRTLRTRRETVFKAWTEAEQLKRWWGPKGFEVLSCEMDLRPGGIFLYCLRTPDGEEMWGRWVLREIVEPERLAFVVSFSDAEAGRTRHPWNASWPLDLLTTVTFIERGTETEVTVTWQPIDATEVEIEAFDAGRESMQQGWTGTLDRLAQHLVSH